jgi:very-short-patch-repair endonuclease
MVARDTELDRPARAYTRARRLRAEPSLGERKMWDRLRDRRFDGLKFRRQTPVGPYVTDFYCEAYRLVVEIDGGQHRMAHVAVADAERDRYFRAKGYRVCRIPHLVAIEQTEAAIEMIRTVIARP